MNRSISALSWGLPRQLSGLRKAAEKALRLRFASHFLSASVPHLSSPHTNTPHAVKELHASVCLRVGLFLTTFFLSLYTTPPTLLSCGAFVIQRGEEEEEYENGFYCSALMLFCCLSGGQNVPATVPLMLNGTGRWIIPCAALSLDKFKGSPTTRRQGKTLATGESSSSFLCTPLFPRNFRSPNFYCNLQYMLDLFLTCTLQHLTTTFEQNISLVIHTRACGGRDQVAECEQR